MNVKMKDPSSELPTTPEMNRTALGMGNEADKPVLTRFSWKYMRDYPSGVAELPCSNDVIDV